MRRYGFLYTQDQRAQTNREKGKRAKEYDRKKMETGNTSRRERVDRGAISPRIKGVIHE